MPCRTTNPIESALRLLVITACVGAALTISGCGSGINSVLQSAKVLVPGLGTPPPAPKLNPKLGYLRLTLGRSVVFMGLGFIDKGPSGPVEVWYSGQGEVLRLQNGRIVGVSGMTVEWRNVVLDRSVTWKDATKSTDPTVLRRVRDAMPGYRYGLREELVVSMVPAPSSSALQGVSPQDLVWFEERVRPLEPGRSDGLVRLPPGRYAVDLRGKQEFVVYAEQCLSTEVCFTWQRWSAMGPVVATR